MSHSTPAPWLDGIPADAIIAAHPTEEDVRHCPRTKYYGGHLIAESVAPHNKPLVKAAPKLLAACELALARCEFPVGAMKAKEALERALAEAKGEMSHAQAD